MSVLPMILLRGEQILGRDGLERVSYSLLSLASGETPAWPICLCTDAYVLR